MSHEIDTGKEFFLALIAGPHEQVSVNWDGHLGYISSEEAMEAIKSDVVDNGGHYMLYRCTPIKEISSQMKVRVKDYEDRNF